MTDLPRNQVRIPNLPMGPIVDSNGRPTDDELNFRQSLLTLLENLMGNEGQVVPAQTQENATIIQNHVQNVPGATPNTQYTCILGTMLYISNSATGGTPPNPPNDHLVVAMNVNTTSSQPQFDQIVIARDSTLYPTAGALAGYLLTTFNNTQYKIPLYELS